MRHFIAISAVSTLLGAEWFHVEPRKTTFLRFFNPLEIFYFNSRPKFSLFVNIFYFELLKTELFRQMFEKTAIYVRQTVDKTENANNNEIKILVLPPASLKSLKICVFRQSCA